MATGNKSDDPMPYVYVRSGEHAWIPGRLLKSDGKSASVVVQKYKDEHAMLQNSPKTTGITVNTLTVDLKEYENGVLPMQNVDDRGKLGDYEDMVNLPYLHEAAILYNIKSRHVKGLPYTRTGDMIVAVNPYQWIDRLYTDKLRKLYANRLVWEPSENDPRTSLSPHVYETSALAYKGMAFDKQNQSILVSGESGAGKTETVKICMNHLASVQEGPNASVSQSKDSSLVVQRVLDSNPLLEAFGNAKTRRNDNSSRFGKYTQLQFDRVGEVGRPVGKLAGSKCEVYLLEKNRVVSHDREERTFHIFYQLLAASDDTKSKIWSGLKGTKNESFKYVGSTNTNMIEGVSDGEQFQRTLSVLHLLGLDWNEDVRCFLRAICVVLQLGNLSFGTDASNDDKSVITSSNEFKALAKLMDIHDNKLALALTERTMKTHSETYKVPLNASMAKDSADALAKEIYGKMFLWLVHAINKATCAEDNYVGGNSRKEFGIIGLLDIFGFESFTVNRFEQLCINYANEKLQQKFTEDIFRSVQAEYKMEGIPLAEIKYDDNTDVLDLIEGRTGLCALLNEECVRPKGSGAGFVNKALVANKKSPCLIADKTDRLSFGIRHYAGRVFYAAENFVTSNMDTLPTDLQECASRCSNHLISAAFQEEAEPERPSKSAPKRLRSNIMAPTVWTKYKSQLSHLMTNLRATNSRYIRCIKPNTVKKPVLMEHTTTVEQLRYAGIVAGVIISRSAFPNRLTNSVVYSRYKNMWDDKRKYPSKKTANMTVAEQIKADCEALLANALSSKHTVENGRPVKPFVVGKTRTYFRAGALEFLESHRITGLDAQATAIQKAARGWLIRKEQIRVERVKKEETALAIQKEKEERERLKQLRKARKEQHRNEMKEYLLQVAALKKKIKEQDERTEKQLTEAKERTDKASKERDDVKQKLDEAVDHHKRTTKAELEHLKTRLASNSKLIYHLNKENKKIRKSMVKDENRLKDVQHKNTKLMGVNHESFSTFDELEDSAKSIRDTNQDLLERREQATDENRHLKDQVQKMQCQYMNVAEKRLELQKTLAKILNTIQDHCKDRGLIETTFCIGHECETEAKCIMAKLEAVESLPDVVMSDTSDTTLADSQASLLSM